MKPISKNSNRQPCVVIVGGTWGFPHGMAASRRVALLGKALISCGYTVEIIHTTISERPGQIVNKAPEGYFQGIHFQYATGTTVAARHFLIRRFITFKGGLKTLSLLRRLQRRYDLRAIIIYSRQISIVSLISFTAMLVKSPSILEINEWTEARKGLPTIRRLLASMFCTFAPRITEGFIVISRFIENKILHRNPKAINSIFYLPIIVDAEEQPSLNPEEDGNVDIKLHQDYLVFSGSLNYQDAIRFILDAFSKVAQKNADCKLVITGKANLQQQENAVREMIAARRLESKVVLTGYIPDSALRQLQRNARCLLAPLEDDDQSKARMPTKIAEYLMTKIPVITSGVGEIPYYLHNKENAYVCPPENVDCFAQAIAFVLENPAQARQVGMNGYYTAKKCFDIRQYAIQLSYFIEHMNIQKTKRK